MKNKSAIFGGIGTGVTAVCCFTPILVIAVVGLGATSLAAYLDYVLFPLLGFFIILTTYDVYGIFRAKRSRTCAIETAVPQNGS